MIHSGSMISFCSCSPKPLITNEDGVSNKEEKKETDSALAISCERQRQRRNLPNKYVFMQPVKSCMKKTDTFSQPKSWRTDLNCSEID